MTELGSREVTVHEIDVPNQYRIVQSCVDYVGFAAANQCATAVRAAELFCLSQARRNRRRSESINGTRQRIQDAQLEPFPPLTSEVFVGHPEREACDALGLALAADNRRRLFCIAVRGDGPTFYALMMVLHVERPS